MTLVEFSFIIPIYEWQSPQPSIRISPFLGTTAAHGRSLTSIEFPSVFSLSYIHVGLGLCAKSLRVTCLLEGSTLFT